jgi:hypothetical protein
MTGGAGGDHGVIARIESVLTMTPLTLSTITMLIMVW